ncbi:hypothetical protein BGZ63DRAFT_59621 [Mariannaea sp. PMI_226]|nr:hypothetical protein BGZ63DRAFT_59621 [Mariannaea sp. PMI_226]
MDWNGRDVDDLLSDVKEASKQVDSGEYLSAKPIFMDCLDGLETLLGPTHVQFVSALDTYVRAAVSHKDFDEAAARLHKSFDDHKEKLDPNDKKVWRCLVRLGKLYRARRLTSPALHMFRRARQGLLMASSNDDLEDVYNCVAEVSLDILNTALAQGDVDEAEKEALALIKQAEELGEAYQMEALLRKYNLILVYDQAIRQWNPSFSRERPKVNHFEKLLSEMIHFKTTDPDTVRLQVRSWDMLCRLYIFTYQGSKLEQLLSTLENMLSGSSPGITKEDRYMYSKTLFYGFEYLMQYDKVKLWLLRMQEGVERQSLENLFVMCHLAHSNFHFGKTDEGASYLKEAQALGKELLPAGHCFHSAVTHAILNNEFVDALDHLNRKVCLDCPGNRAGNESPVSIDEELTMTEGDQRMGSVGSVEDSESEGPSNKG